MKIYVPYYNQGWHILEAEPEQCRRIGSSFIYKNVIYHGENNCYTTADAAQFYITNNIIKRSDLYSLA